MLQCSNNHDDNIVLTIWLTNIIQSRSSHLHSSDRKRVKTQQWIHWTSFFYLLSNSYQTSSMCRFANFFSFISFLFTRRQADLKWSVHRHRLASECKKRKEDEEVEIKHHNWSKQKPSPRQPFRFIEAQKSLEFHSVARLSSSLFRKQVASSEGVEIYRTETVDPDFPRIFTRTVNSETRSVP